MAAASLRTKNRVEDRCTVGREGPPDEMEILRRGCGAVLGAHTLERFLEMVIVDSL